MRINFYTCIFKRCALNLICVCNLSLCVCVVQEMAHAWEEYSRLERSVEQLRTALQAHMNHSATPQVRPATAAPICQLWFSALVLLIDCFIYSICGFECSVFSP